MTREPSLYRKIVFKQTYDNVLILFLLLTEHTLRLDNELIRLGHYYPKGEYDLYLDK